MQSEKFFHVFNISFAVAPFLFRVSRVERETVLTGFLSSCKVMTVFRSIDDTSIAWLSVYCNSCIFADCILYRISH